MLIYFFTNIIKTFPPTFSEGNLTNVKEGAATKEVES